MSTRPGLGFLTSGLLDMHCMTTHSWKHLTSSVPDKLQVEALLICRNIRTGCELAWSCDMTPLCGGD